MKAKIDNNHDPSRPMMRVWITLIAITAVVLVVLAKVAITGQLAW